MAEIAAPVTTTLQNILVKFSPELKSTVKVSSIGPLWMEYNADVGSLINTISVQHSNEDGIHKLIQIAGSNEKYFVSFIKTLLRLDDKCQCGYIAHKILKETDQVDPNIYEIFCSADPAKQHLKVSPIDNHAGEETETSRGHITEHSQATEVVSGRAKHKDHRAVTKNELVKVYAGIEIDALENNIFTLFVNELNAEQRWKRLCDQFHLQRKEVRSVERSENHSKALLDLVGGNTVSELIQCLQDANMMDILQKIPIEIIPESSDMKLRSLDNETFTKISDYLNKDRKWELLSNLLGLKRKDVLKLERKENPAKCLLDQYRHYEVDKLNELLRSIEMRERNVSSENQYNRSEKTNVNAVSNERTKATEEVYPSDPDDVTHEHNNTAESETPVSTNQQILSSDDQLVNNFTFCENNLDRPRVQPVEIQERNIEESLMQNNTIVTRNCEETFEKSVFGRSTSVHNSAACESESNTEQMTLKASGRTANRSDKSVQVNFCHDGLQTRSCVLNNVVTVPENQNVCEKNREQTCRALLNDAYAQREGTRYRDIQNSLPDLCSDGNRQTTAYLQTFVAAPENASDDREHAESGYAATNAFGINNVSAARYHADNFRVVSPETETSSLEKSPEQTCEALINDTNAQCNGTGYRDIQNSLPRMN